MAAPTMSASPMKVSPMKVAQGVLQVMVPVGAPPGAPIVVQAPDSRQIQITSTMSNCQMATIQVVVPPGTGGGAVFNVQMSPADVGAGVPGAMEMQRFG